METKQLSGHPRCKSRSDYKLVQTKSGINSVWKGCSQVSPSLQASGLDLQYYHNRLIDMLVVLERAELDPRGPGIPPPQVQQFMPPLPATPEEALVVANPVRWCKHIDTLLKGGGIIAAPLLFGLQMALPPATVLDIGNLWNGIYTMLTVHSCSNCLAHPETKYLQLNIEPQNN